MVLIVAQPVERARKHELVKLGQVARLDVLQEGELVFVVERDLPERAHRLLLTHQCLPLARALAPQPLGFLAHALRAARLGAFVLLVRHHCHLLGRLLRPRAQLGLTRFRGTASPCGIGARRIGWGLRVCGGAAAAVTTARSAKAPGFQLLASLS
eukprot:4960135-Prymnesium_polylepis.1